MLTKSFANIYLQILRSGRNAIALCVLPFFYFSLRALREFFFILNS